MSTDPDDKSLPKVKSRWGQGCLRSLMLFVLVLVFGMGSMLVAGYLTGLALRYLFEAGGPSSVHVQVSIASLAIIIALALAYSHRRHGVEPGTEQEKTVARACLRALFVDVVLSGFVAALLGVLVFGRPIKALAATIQDAANKGGTMFWTLVGIGVVTGVFKAFESVRASMRREGSGE